MQVRCTTQEDILKFCDKYTPGSDVMPSMSDSV